VLSCRELRQLLPDPEELAAAAPPEELLDEDDISFAGADGVVAGDAALFAGGASFLLHAPRPAPTATIPMASATFFSMSMSSSMKWNSTDEVQPGGPATHSRQLAADCTARLFIDRAAC